MRRQLVHVWQNRLRGSSSAHFPRIESPISSLGRQKSSRSRQGSLATCVEGGEAPADLSCPRENTEASYNRLRCPPNKARQHLAYRGTCSKRPASRQI